jgi:hypothetical protein
MINRQANELGELRARTQQAQQQSDMTGWDEVLYDNPAQAAQMALNAATGRYMQAREAWEELAPGAPANFESNITLKRSWMTWATLQSQTAPCTSSGRSSRSRAPTRW